MKRNLSLLILAAVILCLAAVSCTAEPETQIVEVEVTRITTETAPEAAEVEIEPEVVEIEVTRLVVEKNEVESEETVEGELAKVFRIGLQIDPATVNFWSFVGENFGQVEALVLSGQAGHLYGLSDQRFDFIPELAAELPPDPITEEGFWTITVEMVPDAMWSDGAPITAHDVVFTFNTCRQLMLGGNWAGCQPGILDRVEAIDDTTVKFFFEELPGLGHWQYGAAQDDILPEHFWGDTVAQALADVEGLEETLHPETVDDCGAENLQAEAAAACEEYLARKEAYDKAYTTARNLLYDADPTGAPSAGAFINSDFEPGSFVVRSANPNYYFAGSEIVEYDDGTWTRTLANGRTMQLFNDGSGEETLRYTVGPYVDEVIFTIYDDQSASVQALIDGAIDTLIPSGDSREMKVMLDSSEDVRRVVNPLNGFYYLAFNVRKEPFDDPAFREAVDYLIDKEFVTESVLQGAVIPTYSVVPHTNIFWYADKLETPTVGLTRSERLAKAMEILQAAGYSWDVKPSWDQDDPDAEDLVKGVGLRKPDGTLIEPFVILGTSPTANAVRATFNQWISQWMGQLGIPVESEPTSLDALVGSVFGDGNYDMYVLGWELTSYPDHLCYFFDSHFDTLTAGGMNTTGYNNQELDTKCDEFLAETNVENARGQAHELQTFIAKARAYIPLAEMEVADNFRFNVEFPYIETLSGISLSNIYQDSVKIWLEE